MRRRRRVAKRIGRGTRIERALAVDRLAHGVDHAAEPAERGPHRRRRRRHYRAAAATHAFERRERHQQRVGAGEAHHLARDRLTGLDHHPCTDRHRVDGAGDLDHEAAHADDATVDLDPVELADLLREGFHGVAATAFTHE
jgi:hypothetical protein